MDNLLRSILRPTSVAAVTSLLGFPCTGQSVIYRLDGDRPYQWFGSELVAVGDMDADGITDFTCRTERTPYSQGMRMIEVRSGADGRLLHRFEGAPLEDIDFAKIDGAGDVDGDGHDDLIVGMPGVMAYEGRVVVFSGADGSLLWRIDGNATDRTVGRDVSRAGDIDGDGYGDFVFGLVRSAGASVRVLSGRNASILWEAARPSQDYFGVAIACVGDVDGDGLEDLAVGAPEAGYAEILSGADGMLLYHLTEGPGTDYFGDGVAGAGDFNGDGVPDIAVHHRNYVHGRILVYSGRTGNLIKRIASGAVGFTSPVSVGDINGDGFGDIFAMGESSTFVRRAYIFSGPHGETFSVIDYSWSPQLPASSVYGATSLGDVDHDGWPDLALGVGTSLHGGGSGSLFVISGHDDCNANGVPDLHDVIAGNSGDCNYDAIPDECEIASGESSDLDGNGVPDECACGAYAYCWDSNPAVIGITGPPQVSSDDFWLWVTYATPKRPGRLIYSSSPASVPFGSGTRCIGLPLVRLPPVLADVTGYVRVHLDPDALPQPILPGETKYFQFWFRGPGPGGGVSLLSFGLSLTFAP
jgi:hypothetical protein